MVRAPVLGAVQALDRVRELLDALNVNLGVVLDTGLKSVLILALAWVGYRVLHILTGRIERAVEDDDPATLSEREQRAKTLAQLLNGVGAVTIVIGAVLMILNLFINIGPLLAGVGVAGLAISFGAQSLVKDIIGGFFMLLENQFGVGDIVEINGKAGVVEKMTLRVVVLRDVEGVMHTIPNGSVGMVSNKTRGWSRAVLDVGVAYKENVDRVIDVMKDVGSTLWNEPDWQERLVETPAVWGVQALADSSVNIRIVANTRPGKQFEVGRELRRRIKNRFDEEGIEIPFPQRTLHFSGPESQLDAVARRSREAGTV